MPPTRRRILGAVAGTATTAILAGCAESGDGAGTTADEGTPSPAPDDEPTTRAPTETPTETPTPTDASPTVQATALPDLGDVLVGPDGMTLYMFDPDTQGSGSSACTGGCAEAWPPLTVEDAPTAGSGVTAQLDTFEREDGSTQVAAGGWPLYYFADDAEPGDANGQGVNDVWWVLRPDGTPVRPAATQTATATPATVRVQSHPDLGEILVGPAGETLYMFDPDTQGSGASSCYDGCAQAWPPLTVDGEPTAGSNVTAALSTFEREDGSTQVAAGGWPLYHFVNDAEPGDANGQGVNDVWWVLRPDGTPVRSTAGGTETATSTPTETESDGPY